MCLRESSFTALQQGDINDLLRVSFPVQINRVIIKLASTVGPEALKSAVALVLCLGAGGSEQPIMSGRGLLPCLERHSLRPENGAV